MFTLENVLSRLKGRPFVPTRLVTSTGQQHDVYHPDMVLVARNYLVVGTPASNNPSVVDQVAHIAMIHLTEMRDLAAPIAPSNGEST